MAGDSIHAALPESEVRESLGKVLASPHFAARRRGELLRYLVEKTLAGEGETIGEYGIALDVFGKPESFDPKSESTIRAEMSRLRKGLADYYAAEGAGEKVRLEFPVRGYIPVFSRLEPKAPDLPSAGSGGTRLRWWWGAVAAALIVATLIPLMGRSRASAELVRSVVVLPFANLTGDASNDYLTDGITEGLTDSLAHVESLRVVARTSAFQFRGQAKDIREIGREVNADAVVEGSIRRVGDHMVVTVQVNRSADGFHILSHVFEGKSGDLAGIESRLAEPVVAVLRPRTHVPAGRAPNPDAWALVLRAHTLRGAATPEAFRQSVTYLNDAVRLDPQYVGAWAELANTYASAAVNLHLDPVSAATMAKSAANKALELDANCADAWSSIGFVDAMVLLNWQGGIATMRKALAAAPQDARIHQRLSNLLLLTGEFPESLKEARIAEDLDPLVPNPGIAVALVYFMQRQYEPALTQLQRVAALHPDVVMVHAYVGAAFEALGQYEKAMSEYQLVDAQNHQAAEARIELLLAHSGRGAEARRRLAKYAVSPDSDPFSLAVIYGVLGERDKAFEQLEQAWNTRNCWMLKVSPFLDPLRSDPRYDAMLRRANFTH